MSKPTEIELKTVLPASQTMKEHDKDPFFIARTLLNHNSRLKHYEALLKAADRYVNRGQAEGERTALLNCIAKEKQAANCSSNEEMENFGLE
jgi:hypothetical protein